MLRRIIPLILLLFSLPVFAGEKLHLVTSLDTLEAEEYIKAFEKETGIDVEWIRLSAGEVVARLKAEGERQSQSVWFGASISEMVAAQQSGLLESYRSKSRDPSIVKWSDPQENYTAIYFGSIAFISNKKQLADNHLNPPISWQDLLKEPWRGRLVMAYPYTSGTGYTVL
ncbi:MAG: extracellular solute-binding protein, partial [bacterium]|nr:extracellular solute-binding protein [bacterium]